MFCRPLTVTGYLKHADDEVEEHLVVEEPQAQEDEDEGEESDDGFQAVSLTNMG